MTAQQRRDILEILHERNRVLKAVSEMQDKGFFTAKKIAESTGIDIGRVRAVLQLLVDQNSNFERVPSSELKRQPTLFSVGPRLPFFRLQNGELTQVVVKALASGAAKNFMAIKEEVRKMTGTYSDHETLAGILGGLIRSGKARKIGELFHIAK